MSRRTLCYGLCAVTLLVGVSAGGYLYHVRQGLTRAEDLMRHRFWRHAREELQNYLTWFGQDARARLMYAESLAQDDSLDPRLAASQAVAQLEAISLDSQLKSEALARAGSLQFLVLNQPVRAERSLRQSLQLNPQAADTHHMLWLLYDLTGRHHLTEEVFWRVYELTDEDDRIQCLREWYLSQFYPLSARVELDRMMHFVGPDEAPDRVTESRRYRRYLEEEPDGAMGYAGLARWCQREGDLNSALRFIHEGREKIRDIEREPFFVAAEVQIFLDLGRFADAQAGWQNWPVPKAGYDYCKATALVLDEVVGDYPGALKAYEEALRLWPGPMDWRLRYRYSTCLTRAKRIDLAEKQRQQAKQIENLMDDAVHTKLYAAMDTLSDPTALAEVADLYRQLGRPREADSWLHEVERLRDLSAPQEP